MIRFRFAVAALATLFAFALASPALAIKGGRVSSAPDGVRLHVVQIIGPGGSKCSGTVVSQRLVLTAAHCFLGGHGDYRIRALDPQFRFHYAEDTQVAIHPNFDVNAL